MSHVEDLVALVHFGRVEFEEDVEELRVEQVGEAHERRERILSGDREAQAKT